MAKNRFKNSRSSFSAFLHPNGFAYVVMVNPVCWGFKHSYG